jgi:hypothetical protein
MRSLATALLLLAMSASMNTARAQTTCKVCADQRAACMKNYAGPTCQSEYQMCRKSCKK